MVDKDDDDDDCAGDDDDDDRDVNCKFISYIQVADDLLYHFYLY